jgi:CRP/FNR family transcriptional regulator, cyclic AMP receptor protein
MVTFDVFKNEPNVRTFSNGEKIFSEGEPGDFMFAILEGEVEIRKGGRVLDIIQAGGVFGEMSLIEKQPRSADAYAVADTRLAAIDTMRFYILVQHSPYFALQMLQLLSHRLRNNMTAG